ncbi:predicted protein [Sclerotinia sclerotiorum 1980 UF-70]|uniref:Uncharacterized protein n=1 Tax=Sclerotinia sclerotiorum (strain ATCC 18683 / 1980 / Ss-1) TaxID=665079 RepID=A7EKI4_SCLS1|nr:predicted protein [Sclerotinia sclerotiorum 1980 UF-70]EDO03350.1 predicted protein [Sclerotinia sclerotiorum 1980 UF-70]
MGLFIGYKDEVGCPEYNFTFLTYYVQNVREGSSGFLGIVGDFEELLIDHEEATIN